MISLSGMQALVAVVEEGSFTRAAHRLSATQSGVSQQIGKLERRLDVILLRRSPSGVDPTPAGHALYRKSVAVLEEIARAKTEARSYAGGMTGTIRLELMPALTRSASSRTCGRKVSTSRVFSIWTRCSELSSTPPRAIT